MITKFEDLHYGSSGIVFYWEDKVLLVRPNDPHNFLGGWSYPKGTIDYGETPKQTALREVEEEIGLKLPSTFLDDIEEQELKSVKKPKGVKHYYFYRYNLNETEYEYFFDSSLTIPENKLQLDEVIEARFMEKDEAEKVLSKKFLDIIS